MSGNMSSHERKLRPIYDALDSLAFKAALQTCNKILKKCPTDSTVMALKAVALMHMGKSQEALDLCTTVRKSSKTLDQNIMHSLLQVYQELGKQNEIGEMFSSALKVDPQNELLGTQWFFTMVRCNDYKGQQAASITLQKSFKSAVKYHWWCIMSLTLQAVSPNAGQNPLALTLAERMATRALSEGMLTKSDEFYLFLRILLLQEKFTEALSYISGSDKSKTDIGAKFIDGNIELLRLKRDLMKTCGEWDILAKETEYALTNGDDDWNTISHYTFAIKNQSPKEHERAKGFLRSIAEKDNPPKRGRSLATLELTYQLEATSSNELLNLCQQYFDVMGSKFCYFEDVEPYLIDIDASVSQKFITDLYEKTNSIPDLLRKLLARINVTKLERLFGIPSKSDKDAIMKTVSRYVQEYVEALPLGRDLVETEVQHGNPLALIAAHWLIDMKNYSSRHLLQAIVILEHALLRSRADFGIKLLLIRLYRMIGSIDRAIDIYETMDIKQVQHDTLSHFLFSRISSLSPQSRFISLFNKAESIYASNADETPEMITQAYQYGTYSKVEEFIEFGNRLQNSIQRYIIGIEKIKTEILAVQGAYIGSQTLFNPVNDAISVLTRLKSSIILDKKTISEFRDNRDIKVLASFDGAAESNIYSIREATLSGPEPSNNWVRIEMEMISNLKAIVSGHFDQIIIRESLIDDSFTTNDMSEQELTTCQLVNYLGLFCKSAIDTKENYHEIQVSMNKIKMTIEKLTILTYDEPNWHVFHSFNAELERALYVRIIKQTFITHSKNIQKVNLDFVKKSLDELVDIISKRCKMVAKAAEKFREIYSAGGRQEVVAQVMKDSILVPFQEDEVFGIVTRITDGWRKAFTAMHVLANALG